MGNYLASLQVCNNQGEATIPLDYPRAPDFRGRINVLCGPNGSGKTQLLRIIRSLLEDPSRQGRFPDIHIEQTGTDSPRVLPAINLSRDKKNTGKVDLGIRDSKLNLPKDVPDYRRAALRYILVHLKCHVPALADISDDRWLSDRDLRLGALDALENESGVYLCGIIYLTQGFDHMILLPE
jgi:energy-coupling factor transporter ATP-binding protein EcfA2